MRNAFAVFCVLVATLVVPGAIASTWLSQRVDNTDAYVDSVAPLADDPDLRAELGEQLADAAVAALQEHVPVGLPEGVSSMAQEASKRVVDNKGFPKFWRQANAEAHREFLAIVHEERGGQDPDAWVMVDLGPLLDQVFVELSANGIPVDLLPDVPLEVPVLRESKLQEIQGQYQLLEGLSLWLPLLAGGLVLVAVAVATGWRGRLRVLGGAALGVVVGALVVRAATPPVTDAVVDQADPGQQELARLVLEVVTVTLSDRAMTILIVAGVVAVVCFAASFIPTGRRSTAQQWA